MDAERQEWLETLTVACEDILARLGSDRFACELGPDVTELLGRLRAELSGDALSPG